MLLLISVEELCKIMNRTEQELIELSKKIARNYKMIVAIGMFLYACFVFISTQNQHSQQILTIQSQHSHDINELKADQKAIHARMEENEKNFNMTSVKLDTTLNRISTDLQFIKQKFIERGMK